jgi:transglycosylase-like protein with SLT domain/D-alanyl-D-alanine carboxypeptidase-like protein/putative Flp pilus-assembly TadE/G-like protein
VSSERGQSAVLIVGALFGLLIGAFVLGAVARGIGSRSAAQRSADLAALAGARAMLDAYPRLFEPVVIDGVPNPRHLSREAYLDLGEQAALAVAERNGEAAASVTFPDADEMAPVRIRVEVRREVEAERGGAKAATEVAASAEAELSAASIFPSAGAGEYSGPFAIRQGQKMRPDVAQAFDRMAAAARADGVALLISSAWRSDAEQAILFARHPDPKWVAPPGTSLHRLGTELDLGPATAYGWLAANAPRFGFQMRYPWEPWHFGYVMNASSSSSARDSADGALADHANGHPSIPGFVPAEYADDIALAAQRWNVSANLLSAQLYAESGFNPFAVSPVGAQGIAQFMPSTAAGLGLANPFDAEASIDAQAHLMRDLLRQFGSVPLALAAYNAGPAPVAACMCVPPYEETRAYVARILGLMGGAGDVSGGGLAVRLVG